MNKLGYGILSLLATEKLTGYDINRIMSSFWHTTHSAIYPMLAKLEEKEFLEYNIEIQEGKPDKKIYSITNKGLKILKKWILSTPDKIVIKDEMMLKIYCLKMLEKKTSIFLLKELDSRNEIRKKRYLDSLKTLKDIIKKDEEKRESYFGRYLLIQKAINDVQEEIKWVSWIRDLIENEEEYFENDFFK